MTNSPTPQRMSWEQRYDKEDLGCCSAGEYCDPDHDADLKAFIREVEEATRREERERIGSLLETALQGETLRGMTLFKLKQILTPSTSQEGSSEEKA